MICLFFLTNRLLTSWSPVKRLTINAGHRQEITRSRDDLFVLLTNRLLISWSPAKTDHDHHFTKFSGRIPSI